MVIKSLFLLNKLNLFRQYTPLWSNVYMIWRHTSHTKTHTHAHMSTGVEANVAAAHPQSSNSFRGPVGSVHFALCLSQVYKQTADKILKRKLFINDRSCAGCVTNGHTYKAYMWRLAEPPQRMIQRETEMTSLSFRMFFNFNAYNLRSK